MKRKMKEILKIYFLKLFFIFKFCSLKAGLNAHSIRVVPLA